jgi:O-antigen/teichoic acid export membrane protein
MQQSKPVLSEPMGTRSMVSHLRRVRQSRLVRQNLVLFAGGMVSGIGGFVYHAIAGRVLGPQLYGEVASLVALYAVGTAIQLILILVLARYAADLLTSGKLGALRSIMGRTSVLLALPAVLCVALAAALSGPAADFLHLGSRVPILWLGAAVAVCWYVAVPRGVLQGIQSFGWLSANLSLELVIRTTTLILLLAAGLSVTGSMTAVLLGVVFAYLVGMWSLRGTFRRSAVEARMRTMLGFAVTAAAGTLGILLLYNLDVVLAAHYLQKHDAGIYGGLNKIETIIYFGTLSVSQVLFPRVVEAVATRRHPGLLLLMSAGLMAILGLCAVAVFALAPGLVVGILFGPAFRDAQGYLLLIGLIGLGLSLNNLLVQFFMAVHDRVFIPILGTACVVEAALIVLFHASLAQVVGVVLAVMGLLLAGLAVRFVILLPRLRPEMLQEARSPALPEAD